MPPHVRPLIKRSFGRIVTETPFNLEWVSAIKEIIPKSRRDYGSGNTWSFDPMYYIAIRTTFEHFFGSAYIDATGGVVEPQSNDWRERWDAWREGRQKQRSRESHGPRAPVNPKVNNAFETLYVTSNAPKEVVTASFRALSKLHHPDNGGEIEIMARINAAYDELKKIGRA